MKRALLGVATPEDQEVDRIWTRKLYKHYKASRKRVPLGDLIRRDSKFAQNLLADVRAGYTATH